VLRRASELAGVEFIDENGGGSGVRAPGDCDHLFQLIATRRSN
jgi:hypothetical protein